MSVKPCTHPYPEEVLKHKIKICMDLGCSLKGFTASTIVKWHGLHTCIRSEFSQLSQIWGSVCGGNNENVKPYAHPESEVLEPFIYVCHG